MPPLLHGIVALAFFVEAIAGFGGGLLSLSLGVALLPLDELLPACVFANLALSLGMLRGRGPAVDRPLLLRRVIPLMAGGFPLGAYAFAKLPPPALQATLGMIVCALAVWDLVRLHREQIPSRLAQGLALLGGGAIHGALGTGGPLAVWAISRERLQPEAFRGTLAALWVVMSLALLGSLAVQGHFDRTALIRGISLLPATLVGLGLGNLAASRIAPTPFRVLVSLLLVGAGALLLLR